MSKRSIYLISMSIIIGFIILGLFIFYSQNAQQYQIITQGESIIVFDKKTGEYWQKYLSQTEAPTEWKKFKSPIK